VKIRDISLSQIEPFGTRDTAAQFGTVPKNSGRLATLFVHGINGFHQLFYCLLGADGWSLLKLMSNNLYEKFIIIALLSPLCREILNHRLCVFVCVPAETEKLLLFRPLIELGDYWCDDTPFHYGIYQTLVFDFWFTFQFPKIPLFTWEAPPDEHRWSVCPLHCGAICRMQLSWTL